jgi:hypothetical protein
LSHQEIIHLFLVQILVGASYNSLVQYSWRKDKTANTCLHPDGNAPPGHSHDALKICKNCKL